MDYANVKSWEWRSAEEEISDHVTRASGRICFGYFGEEIEKKPIGIELKLFSFAVARENIGSNGRFSNVFSSASCYSVPPD